MLLQKKFHNLDHIKEFSFVSVSAGIKQVMWLKSENDKKMATGCETDQSSTQPIPAGVWMIISSDLPQSVNSLDMEGCEKNQLMLIPSLNLVLANLNNSSV